MTDDVWWYVLDDIIAKMMNIYDDVVRVFGSF
jgi:hypothetical protein